MTANIGGESLAEILENIETRARNKTLKGLDVLLLEANNRYEEVLFQIERDLGSNSPAFNRKTL